MTRYNLVCWLIYFAYLKQMKIRELRLILLAEQHQQMLLCFRLPKMLLMLTIQKHQRLRERIGRENLMNQEYLKTSSLGNSLLHLRKTNFLIQCLTERMTLCNWIKQHACFMVP
uniref:Small glutamine-rich tetratricopeptide repeat-containing protein 2 n=1 Tax=Rhizophora mucronata TaxID=61149 RepID=A0A2P2LG31_RHIMU